MGLDRGRASHGPAVRPKHDLLVSLSDLVQPQ